MIAGESGEIRAGVAGAGVFGGYHAQKYAAIGDVRMAAVYDRSRARAAALAEKYQVPPYTNYSEFLDAVDVLSVTAPAGAHFDLAQKALRAGRHCLIEKPISLNVADAERLVDLARSAGRVIQVGHQERFVAEAEGLLDNAGQMRRVSWRRCGPPTGRCEDVSVVFDLMIHDLDLARQLHFGDPIRIEAAGGAHEVEARMWFDQGRRFDFVASRRTVGQDRTMSIDYASGDLMYDFVMRAKTGSSHECANGARAAPGDPLMVGVEKFIGAVRGHYPVAISGEDGLRALEWACLVETARLDAAGAGYARSEAVA